MKEQKKDRLESISLISGILILCVILSFTVSAVKTAGQCYEGLKNTDLSRGTDSLLYYDDHLYGQLGFGITLMPNEPGGGERLASFLASSVREIDMWIISCGLLYSTVVSTVLQYFVYSRYHSDKKRHFIGVLTASAAPAAVYAAVVLISQKVFGLPAVFSDGRELLLIAAGLLSIMAGNCALGAVLSASRRKKLTAVLAVPAVMLLFIVSMNMECHLYTSPTEDSFDYFYEEHSGELPDDGESGFYYDKDKNVICLYGEEYPPETVVNPEYYTGWKRACAFLFELVDAYSGNGLMFTEKIIKDSSAFISLRTAAAYIVKAAVWIVFLSFLPKRRRIREQPERDSSIVL